jgi:membrane fusion protein (multidrug efflux system)
LVAVAGIDVSSEVAGKVKAIHFESGQSVQRGQLLVELDSSTDVAELKGLEASQKLEQVKFARSQKLIGRNFISKSDYDLNKALLDEAKAAVAAKKSVIEKKRIVAPFAGQLGIRKVNVGQYLAPGDGIVPLQKLQPIYADFTLPEHHLAKLNVNQTLTLTVQAYPDKIFNGRIAAINSGIDETTRSVKIRSTLDNVEELLRPGMFVDVQVLLNETKSVLTVPDTAISYNPYGDSVFAIESGKQGLTVQLKQIVTGETREGRIEIVKGLLENERVVSAGQVKLRNGMSVTLDKQPAPGERETTQ